MSPNVTKTASAIPWTELGPALVFALIVVGMFLFFLYKNKPNPVLNTPKSTNQSDVILDKFTGYMQNTLTDLMGKNIDCTRELHKDVAVMAKESSRTHEKVGKILSSNSEMVKEITDNFDRSLEHSIEKHVIVRIEGITTAFERMTKVLERLECTKI